MIADAHTIDPLGKCVPLANDKASLLTDLVVAASRETLSHHAVERCVRAELGSHSADELEVLGLIEETKGDKDAIEHHTLTTKLPEDLRLQFMSDDFVDTILDKFNAVDTDGNGVLTPDELFPVISELVTCPWAITLEHCERFLHIFDENNDGVINLSEFHSFLIVTCLISYLEAHRENQKQEVDLAAVLTGARYRTW